MSYTMQSLAPVQIMRDGLQIRYGESIKRKGKAMKESPFNELDEDTQKLAALVSDYFRNADIPPNVAILQLQAVADNIVKAAKQFYGR